MGTIFVERIADIVVIFVLVLAAGFWSFRGRQRPELDFIFVVGFLVASTLLLLLIVLRFAGQHVERILPNRVEGFYVRFREGSTAALTPRAIAVIGSVTIVIWLAEGLRVFFVLKALDLPDAQLGISAAIFVALVAAPAHRHPADPGRHRLRGGWDRGGVDPVRRQPRVRGGHRPHRPRDIDPDA